MIFKKITLKDFRPYYGLQTIEFIDGKNNITLIQAENGTGKTTLLEAFKWCFYGEKLNLPNPNKYVNEKAEAQTQTGDEITVDISIEFEENGNFYQIIRSALFKKMKAGMKQIDSSFQFKNISNGKDPISGTVAEKKVASLLPKELNFFFDGERLKQLNNKTVKRNEIENILGIKAYKNAQSDLKRVINNYEDKIMMTNEANEKYELLKKEKKEIENKIIKKEEEIENYENQVNDYDLFLEGLYDKREILEKEIENKNEIGKKLAEKNQKKRDLSEKRITNFLKYKKCLSKILPKIFYKEEIELAYKKIEKIRKEGSYPAIVRESLIDDLIKLGTCLCGHQIKEEEKEKLLSLKKDSSDLEVEDFFYEIKNCLKLECSNNLNIKLKELKDLKKEYLNVKRAFSDLIEEINILERDFSEKDEEKLKEYEELKNLIRSYQSEKDKQTGQILEISTNVEDLKSELRKVQNGINNETKRSDKNEIKKAKDMAKKLYDILDYLYKAKLENERKKLDKKIKTIFNKVTRKGYTIELDSKFNLKVYKENVSNDEMVGLSTGENKMVTLCFIGAIVDLAREINKEQKDYDIGGGVYPIVLDSPYGDLDNDHKREMTDTIYQLSDQIIIFASSSQWSQDVEEIMKNRVGKRYRLDNKNTENSNEKYEFTLIKEVN